MTKREIFYIAGSIALLAILAVLYICEIKNPTGGVTLINTLLGRA